MSETATGSDRWSLRQRVTRAMTGVFVLLAVLVGLILYSVVDSKERGDDVVERWDPAFLASQNALAAMVNQETGIRGYALGGEEAFLEPYTRYLTLEDEALADLRDLVQDDGTINSLLDDYAAAVDQWHATVAAPVVERVRAGDTGATALTGSDQARNAFDVIRTSSARLTDEIEQRRAENIEARADSFRRTWFAVGISAVLMLGAGLLLWRGLRRSVLGPIDDLGAQTRVVAGGDLGRHIEPDGPSEIVDLGRDVDSMRARLADEIARVERARTRLERRSAELARSNADLEQFAYVASHDLSEPLRKVTNFCQLLERQYGDQLDDKARQYIAFMVDGAKRMQILITDLLAFSRVGRTTEHFVDVDLDRALTQALSTLEEPIAESGAVVVREPLPTVPGDATLLTALLQNMVGNAVKYRSPERTPRVEVSCAADPEGVRITVDDNGIGIDRQYADRIFAIFQRLHLRDQYGGTGIGLALCRKITDFHGGRIWLADKTDAGARFHIILPTHQAPAEETDDDEPASLAAT